MLYRIWSRTRKQFATEWCDAKAGFWDDAVRGSSPLQAALHRLVADELTQHTDKSGGLHCLFDLMWKASMIHFSLSLVARAGLKLAYLPCFIGIGTTHMCRGSFLNRRVQRFQRGNCHQQWGGSGMRSGQPRCEIGALRHPAEVARAASIHHDCAMGG